MYTCTVGTPYNTNVGVQKIPDRAIWKPMVAKRNNTNPWSWLRPQILVTQDSGQSHMSKQPASRDWPEQIAPLMHSITDCLTTLLSRSIYWNTHSPPAGPCRAASYKMYFTHLTLFLRVVNNKSVTERSHHACALITSNLA